MVRQRGVQYPERQLMAVISDLLGIRHFTTSRGSTVRKDFLEAVAARLGVREPESYKKDPLLQAVIEAATRAPMDETLYSPGTTVTDRALQTIIDGIVDNGLVVGRGGAVANLSLPAVAGGLPIAQEALGLPIEKLEALLDPDEMSGPFDRRLLALAYRESQDQFRTDVLVAYSHDDAERCCVTGYGPSQVLEAVRIAPELEGGPTVVSNALCLRADLRLLFDRRLLAVHEADLTVLLHQVLEPTPYWQLLGQKIHIPRDPALRPSRAALRKRREDAGL